MASSEMSPLAIMAARKRKREQIMKAEGIKPRPGRVTVHCKSMVLLMKEFEGDAMSEQK